MLDEQLQHVHTQWTVALCIVGLLFGPQQQWCECLYLKLKRESVCMCVLGAAVTLQINKNKTKKPTHSKIHLRTRAHTVAKFCTTAVSVCELIWCCARKNKNKNTYCKVSSHTNVHPCTHTVAKFCTTAVGVCELIWCCALTRLSSAMTFLTLARCPDGSASITVRRCSIR